MEERIAQARRSADELEIASTILVDNMMNETWQAFGSAPSPAFIIDSQGHIVLRQVWVDPDEIRVLLRSILKNQ